METVRLKVITIVAEAILEERLTADLKELGAAGFTISEARGEGSVGRRTMDWETQNLRFEVLVAESVARRILERLAADYFPHYATVAWVADAEVVRGEKYLGR
jgi:nitrogen regulatory protein P-II 2